MSVADVYEAAPMPGEDRGSGRVPPQDMAAEQSVLGAMLISKNAIDPAADVLQGRDFYRPAHELIFDTIVDLVNEGLAPPDTTAALYRALTRIPGVEVDDSARDLLGRPGVGITRTDDVFQTRTVVIIDPATGETIGARYLMSTLAGDEVFGATAIVARGIADSAGDEPDDVVPTGGAKSADPA